jgi:hypothetical protein
MSEYKAIKLTEEELEIVPVLGRVVKNKITGVIRTITIFSLTSGEADKIVNLQHYKDYFLFYCPIENIWVEWETELVERFTYGDAVFYSKVIAGTTCYFVNFMFEGLEPRCASHFNSMYKHYLEDIVKK